MIDDVIKQIKKIGEKYEVKKLVLFGSRARGDNSSVSDYDIAVFGNNLSDIDRIYFRLDIEETNTLKKIDIVFVDENFTEDHLMENIEKEGVVIYE